jgi:hypothetical protein
MPWTTPGTAVAGAVLESSFWNSNVRDNTLLLYAQSQYPYRNLLYNGAMQISQRGTSTSGITASGYYTADRFATTLGSLGTWTQTIENDAPTGSGLRRSVKLNCTTASASPAAGGVLLMEQILEGFDVQRIAKGTSSAQPLVLTFWVKSNVTGTYVVEIRDGDNTRHICRTYTVSASATWEKKEISIPPDATGAFDNDANGSLSVQFWLGAGSTFTSGTLASSWAASSNANRAVGQTNLASATNNYWQVTGVQLEVGSVATPFESLPYGDELARCQRYYYRHVGATNEPICLMHHFSTTAAEGAVQFPVSMRIAPNSAIVNGTNFFIFYIAGSQNVSTVNLSAVKSVNAALLDISGLSSSTAGSAGMLYTSTTAGGVIAFSAEL